MERDGAERVLWHNMYSIQRELTVFQFLFWKKNERNVTARDDAMNILRSFFSTISNPIEAEKKIYANKMHITIL